MSLPRPRVILILVLASITSYLLLSSTSSLRVHVVPYIGEEPIVGNQRPLMPNAHDELAETKSVWHIDIDDLRYWSDPDDHEDPNDTLPGFETDGKNRDPGSIGRLKHEKDLRKMWRYVYKTTANLKSSNLIYGNTLQTLSLRENRSDEHSKMLREDPRVGASVAKDMPVRFNPYPDYNSAEWRRQKHAPYVPCKGPTGELVEDLLVYKGRPRMWPTPKFGSYEALNMDPNLCWERDTRLGPFGLVQQKKKVGGEYEAMNWDNVNWGDLKRAKENEYLSTYPETAPPASPASNAAAAAAAAAAQAKPATAQKAIDGADSAVKGRSSVDEEAASTKTTTAEETIKEKRTAILLRSYTGKKYTENDKQVIRAMVSELTLKTGGEFEVFLLVHSKYRNRRIFDDQETYLTVLRESVPPEFRGMTVLWNDEQVWKVYTELKDDEEKSVHTAQWLSVQKFSHDHPQFDYIWNWEMDFRFTGHHYDLLDSLAKFAKKQPRKYLWERNERWYIPEHHGDYDTDFRREVAERHGNDTVWGPPELPFINPVGPKPPVKSHEEDDYQWGVGEEADFISAGPIFDPINSQWIIGKHVWGFKDRNHDSLDLPRRTTIVTHSRLSKRLLDMMHVENMRGNHVASEMMPQTIALLHGFKAVFAPHPVFMDRDWKGGFINSWFNPGPKGECGGRASPMGWGRERRYQGTTWYYRAEPPNRLYNNWMGWPDTGFGGAGWEEQHGRPCLPSMMLHQVKDTEPTDNNHRTGFDLAFG